MVQMAVDLVAAPDFINLMIVMLMDPESMKVRYSLYFGVPLPAFLYRRSSTILITILTSK